MPIPQREGGPKKDKALANDNSSEGGTTLEKLALIAGLDEDVLLKRIAAVLARRATQLAE